MKDAIIENRIKMSTKHMTNDDLVRRTENNLLSLRKGAIEDYILKKRQISLPPISQYQINPLSLVIPHDMQLNIPQLLENFDIKQIWSHLFSNETNLLKYGLFILRKYIANALLFKETDVHSKKLSRNDGSVANLLCSLLQYPDNQVKYEASWIVINLITFSEKVEKYFYTETNMEHIITFFFFADECLLDHALWIIFNSTTDNQENRIFYIKRNIVDHLGRLLNSFETFDNIKEKCLLVARNLCKEPQYELIPFFFDFIEPLVKYFSLQSEVQTIKNILLCLYKLSSPVSKIIDILIESNIYYQLLEIMNKHDDTVKLLVVKILANMVSSKEDLMVQKLIDSGIINVFKQMLEDEEIKIRKEVMFGISNIAAGTISQVEVLHESGVIVRVLELSEEIYENLSKGKIYKEAFRDSIFTLANAVEGGLKNIKSDLLMQCNANILKVFVNSLNVFPTDIALIFKVLLSIKDYLILEENEMLDIPNSIKAFLITYGLAMSLETFLTYPSDQVKAIAQILYDAVTN